MIVILCSLFYLLFSSAFKILIGLDLIDYERLCLIGVHFVCKVYFWNSGAY